MPKSNGNITIAIVNKNAGKTNKARLPFSPRMSTCDQQSPIDQTR